MTKRLWRCAMTVMALLPGAGRAEARTLCVEGINVYDGDFDANAVRSLEDSTVPCVHLRFRQDIWTSVDDPTPRGARALALLPTYDALIGLYHSLGMEVVLEVGADALGARNEDLRDAAVRTRYVGLFGRLVARYARQVKVFELLDEPNLRPRSGITGRNALEAGDYADLVVRAVEEAGRLTPPGPCTLYQVILGGLRNGPGPEVVGDDIGPYLEQLYQAGLDRGRWTEYRTFHADRLPFEGIAVHVFVPNRQPGISLSPATIAGLPINRGALQVENVVNMREGSPNARPIWFTGTGWASDDSETDNRFQGEVLDEFIDQVFANTVDPIEMVNWYAFLDPPYDRGGWGLYAGGVIARSRARPSNLAFQGVCNSHRPILDARLAWTEPTLHLAPGQTYPVRLRVSNRGPATDPPVADWLAFGDVYIGAAQGCPFADEVNLVRWTRFPTGGTSGMGPAEARVRLIPGRFWYGGAQNSIEWEITAPIEPGRYPLAARMVRGERNWFGQTAVATVIVAPADDAAIDALADLPNDLAADLPADLGAFDGGVDAPSADALGPPDVRAFDTLDVTRAPDATRPPDARTTGGCGCSAPRGAHGSIDKLAWILAFAVFFRRRKK